MAGIYQKLERVLKYYALDSRPAVEADLKVFNQAIEAIKIGDPIYTAVPKPEFSEELEKLETLSGKDIVYYTLLDLQYSKIKL